MPRNLARALFTLTGVVAVAAVVVAWFVLPERVPTHFGGTGAADDWSSRGGAVTFLAVFTLGLIALFEGLFRWVPKMSTQWLNIPNKRQWIDAGLEPELRRRLGVDLLVFGTGMNVVALATTLSMVQAARAGTDQLPWWWFVVMGAWLVFTVAQVVVMHAVRYRLGR